MKLEEITGLLGLPAPEAVDGFLTALIAGDAAAAVEIADTLYADGFDPEQFIQESIRAARDGVLALTKQAKDLPKFAQQERAAEKLPAIIRALVQATQDVVYVPQPLIALQLAILTVASQKQGTPTQTTASPPVKKVQTSQPSPAVSLAATKRVAVQPKSIKPAESAPTAQKPAFTVQQVADVWSQVIDKVNAELHGLF